MASCRLVLMVALAGCGSDNKKAPIDAPVGDDAPAVDAPSGTPATQLFASVGVTTLVGASPNAGAAGTFSTTELVGGDDPAPSLSNSVLSSIPGVPPKPLFVGQSAHFDSALIAVDGLTGSFEVPAGSTATYFGLDLVTTTTAASGNYTIKVATKTGGKVSQVVSFRLLVDSHAIIASGDLYNHDTAGTNIADLFGALLEGKQNNPPMPMQIVDGHNNNADTDPDGAKGLVGAQATGHREIVWDGVPEALRNVKTFSPTFFDRQSGGAAGVQGGAIFTPTGGTSPGLEVNDALDGVTPTTGPPTNPNTPLGGDFSNVNRAFYGDLIAFTQNATFSPVGTNVTDVTFHVAGSQTKAVVVGAGVVFISVDNDSATTIEFFDENNVSLEKITVPPRSVGPFPIPGPITGAPGAIPYSFAGYVDRTKRVARVHITAGEVAVDKATLNDHLGTPDVVVLDDVYYGEPNP